MNTTATWFMFNIEPAISADRSISQFTGNFSSEIHDCGFLAHGIVNRRARVLLARRLGLVFEVFPEREQADQLAEMKNGSAC